ncbi:MAG: response regulator [Oscillospiraceae bacterium]|nr:response regulator [Oscillospiraceae bacterium]
MKILIVDDSSVMRKVIKAAADVLDLSTEEAQDGIEALEILSQRYEEIDLVLLDWNMPGKTGFEVLEEIKSNDKMKSIPVMMVTTEGHKTSIVAAVRAGADNYLVKPFTIDELESKIVECIGKGGGA